MRLAPKTIGALFALPLLAACSMGPMRPAGVSDVDIATFSAGMEKAGCTILNARSAAVVERHTGFSEEKLRSIADYLTDTGKMVRVRQGTATGIRLKTGGCA